MKVIDSEGKLLWSKPYFEELITTPGGSTCKKLENFTSLTVIAIGAGGHGGAGGGITNWGGVGGVGGLVTKIYEGEEFSSLPDSIDVFVGICPSATGATGQSTSFNEEVIAYGGNGGTNGVFGGSGSNGANGSGEGGEVRIGAPASDRTFNGVIYGSGGSGTQGGGGGYQGTQGVIKLIWSKL